MKFIFTRLVILSLFTSFGLYAANGNKENTGPLYHGAAYKAGTLIINVKTQYRQNCSDHSIEVPQLKAALDKIAATSVDKKFAWIQQPKEKFNKYGKPLVDLSLVYQVKFSASIDIETAMEIVKGSGVVEYAEPHYIHQLYFTPNDPNLGSQYFITKIKADSAWNSFRGDTNIVIGIVDSGTDWDHPDLVDNVKYNYADPINGVDDDNDGFIDNYRGWDVSENDNDPMVNGQDHGSHVSGCAAATTNNNIGVASPAYNCKFIGIKSSLDGSQVIDNGYDGLVYGADHGVNVLNCSWGRTGNVSQFEQQTINYCVDNKDVVVVSAAGNDGLEEEHYPSSYDNVVSVAATSSNDNKSNFSNYGHAIDVCAPGSNIFSTWYNDTYTALDGTSMASPIAAGCAAMIKAKFPSLNAYQVGEQLRTTCDNIYNLGVNVFYGGLLGKGRVNLYKAVTDSVSPGVRLVSSTFTDNYDDVFLPGDTIAMTSLFENLLRPTTNLVCSLTTTSPDVTILQNNFNAGVLNTFDTISNFSSKYSIKVKPTAPLNATVELRVWVKDGSWADSYIETITVNVDYVNIAINNVATSITSHSTIGYNLQGQAQGLGFTYKDGPSILYDMGFMVGASGKQVSDNVRGDAGNDDDFAPVANVVAHNPGTVSDFDVNGIFRDNGAGSIAPLNIVVRHNAYAWINAPDENYVMVQYFINNVGTDTLVDLWAGIFADWDIPAFANNKCSTDNTLRMGYIWSTDSGGLYGGIKLLSHTGSFNHYAFDNTAANGGIDLTDGFSNTEKYLGLSTARANAGTATVPGNDVLSSVSSGPWTLYPGDSVSVCFALIAAKDIDELYNAAWAAQDKYDQTIGILPVSSAISNKLGVYPNPANREVHFEFSISEKSNTELSIYNMTGEKVKTVINESLPSGTYTVTSDVHELPAGNYIYKIQSGQFIKTLPLLIAR